MSLLVATSALESLDAGLWPGLCAGMLQAKEARLVVARLSGARAALGRYQRSASVLVESALSQPALRRVTGGRAIALGEGMVALALVLPAREWLEEGLSADRVLNRAVRGGLAGLRSMGAQASYFGRDFLSVDSTQAGLLGFELTSEGTMLFECILAAESHWWLPASVDALPPRAPVRGVPGPGRIEALVSRPADEILGRMVEGYARSFPLHFEPALTGPEAIEFVLPEEELPLRSALHPVPCGFLEVGASLDEAGLLTRLKIQGDFLADSGAVEALEKTLLGLPPQVEAMAPHMNAVFTDPAHALLGLRDLEVLAHAIREACAR